MTSFFIDTNIIAYGYDKGAKKKHEAAVELFRNLWQLKQPPFISVQVIQELNATLNKLGYSSDAALTACEHYLKWRVISLTPELIKKAFEIKRRYQTSVWDSTIIAAAQHARATKLLSEDLNAGQNFDGVVVVNPFSRQITF